MGSNKVWTEEEVERLKKTYHLYTDAELCEIFHVNDKSIKFKRHSLGLLRVKKRDIPEGYYYCPNCDKILPAECFGAGRVRGRSDYCRECKNIRAGIQSAKRMLNYQESGISRQEKIYEYKEKIKDKKLFCPKCNKEKTIDDYDLCVCKDGAVKRTCRDCKRIRNRKVREKKKSMRKEKKMEGVQNGQ